MKKCTYCGREYGDDATICSLDQFPLALVEEVPFPPEVPRRDALGSLRSISPQDLVPHLMKLKVRTSEHGICLIWKCPHCVQMTDFIIRLTNTNVSLAGFEFAAAAGLVALRCSSCRYELSVDPSESQWLGKLSEATVRLQKEEITPEDYHALVRSVPAQFAKDLLSFSQTWKCPACGEQIPGNFDTCWNCASIQGPDLPPVPDDAQPFPKMPRGGNSWE